MKPTVGQTTDNGSKVGLRRGSLGPMPLVPDSRSPSTSLVAIVAALVVILLLGATVVVYREVIYNGVAPEATGMNTPQSGDCWQKALPADTQCPPLTGEDAMRWLFQSNPDFSECTETKGATGELFTLQCEYADLNANSGGVTTESTYIFLSEWENSQAMMTYYDKNFGEPTLMELDGEPNTALHWSALSAGGAGPSTAIGYANYPYSVLVMGPETNRDTAELRIKLRPPSQLQAQL